SLMQTLGRNFDRIVLDSPPLMSVTDARILAAEADATLLVLRMNQSMRDLGLMALQGLHTVGARVVGAVANDVPTAHAARYSSPWPYKRMDSTDDDEQGHHGRAGNGLALPPLEHENGRHPEPAVVGGGDVTVNR